MYKGCDFPGQTNQFEEKEVKGREAKGSATCQTPSSELQIGGSWQDQTNAPNMITVTCL